MLPGIERQPRKKLEPSPERLPGLLHRWRDEVVGAGRTITRIAVAFEAGRDGFWLARWLEARGVEAHVIHPTSVAVSREHPRAKTDRLDTELLKRGFLGWLRASRRRQRGMERRRLHPTGVIRRRAGVGSPGVTTGGNRNTDQRKTRYCQINGYQPLLVGLRDRALIGVMVSTFARVNAVTQLKVKDYYTQGRRGWIRLHEKAARSTTFRATMLLKRCLTPTSIDRGKQPPRR